MRILLASIAIFAACGSTAKKQGAVVNEGFDVLPTCCCKTLPVTAEKELVPFYAIEGRMDCSTKNGDCVDDVQCNGVNKAAPESDTGVPPPPAIAPAQQPAGIP